MPWSGSRPPRSRVRRAPAGWAGRAARAPTLASAGKGGRVVCSPDSARRRNEVRPQPVDRPGLGAEPSAGPRGWRPAAPRGGRRCVHVTRDHGRLDEEGFLYVEGRMDDTIIRGAENIAPAEIEDVLLRHPDVLDAVVVGVPDEVWGQRIEAVVVARPGSGLDVEELRAACRGHAAQLEDLEPGRLLGRAAHGQASASRRRERPRRRRPVGRSRADPSGRPVVASHAPDGPLTRSVRRRGASPLPSRRTDQGPHNACSDHEPASPAPGRSSRSRGTAPCRRSTSWDVFDSGRRCVRPAPGFTSGRPAVRRRSRGSRR